MIIKFISVIELPCLCYSLDNIRYWIFLFRIHIKMIHHTVLLISNLLLRSCLLIFIWQIFSSFIFLISFDCTILDSTFAVWQLVTHIITYTHVLSIYNILSVWYSPLRAKHPDIGSVLSVPILLYSLSSLPTIDSV